MDHNYARPDHLQSVVTVWTSNGEDPNHFHPDYFGKGYRWHDPMVWRMEVAYRKAREVFEANGRGVKNANVGGQLEVFERTNYERLFAKSRAEERRVGKECGRQGRARWWRGH